MWIDENNIDMRFSYSLFFSSLFFSFDCQPFIFAFYSQLDLWLHRRACHLSIVCFRFFPKEEFSSILVCCLVSLPVDVQNLFFFSIGCFAYVRTNPENEDAKKESDSWLTVTVVVDCSKGNEKKKEREENGCSETNEGYIVSLSCHRECFFSVLVFIMKQHIGRIETNQCDNYNNIDGFFVLVLSLLQWFFFFSFVRSFVLFLLLLLFYSLADR